MTESVDPTHELVSFLEGNALTWQRVLGVDASARRCPRGAGGRRAAIVSALDALLVAFAARRRE